MRLALMQPYFFPYLGYFDLINYTDKFIILDTVQYIKGGWINRNRVLNNQNSWKYLTVPLRQYKHDTRIVDIYIDDSSNWHKKTLDKLMFYRKEAPYFEPVWGLMRKCMEQNEVLISRLNVICLNEVCNYLKINFKYEFFSEMNLPISEIKHAGEWALNISEFLGVDEYVNLPGGKVLFDERDFQERGMQLILRDIPVFEYQTTPFEFIPNLSIIDVLMWNSPEQVKCYLDSLKNKEFNLKENEKS